MDIARKRQSDSCEQSVRDHLLNVSRLCERTGARCLLSAICLLIGLIHDMGKC